MAPPTARLHQGSHTTHSSICGMPNRKPNRSPLRRMNTNSSRPQRWNRSTMICLSRVMAPTTCVLTSHTSGTRACISPSTAATSSRPCRRTMRRVPSTAPLGTNWPKLRLAHSRVAPRAVRSAITPAAMASMPGSSRRPHVSRSRRPNTSRTSSRRRVIRSTMVVLILRTLHGTMPCHPNSPSGVSGHRFQFSPRYSSGLKIIFTASALVSQFSTPAMMGMAQYRCHCAANLA
mmetsp:Transcript_15630/g.37934  ORF Transcript_15630/g.37934 Transcript_15630/m.37934 type:complete len:233 (-) Transcript_15630:95-793(-)